jgi:hypothetical protein
VELGGTASDLQDNPNVEVTFIADMQRFRDQRSPIARRRENSAAGRLYLGTTLAAGPNRA